MGSTEDYMQRLLTRRDTVIPVELEAISNEIEKLKQQIALLKQEKFDLNLEIDSLNKRCNQKTFLDLPLLVLQEVAICFAHPDELLWTLSLVSPALASVITLGFQQKVETAIEEKSFSLLIENHYLDEVDIQNFSKSASPKLEGLAEKCWRFLEEPRFTTVEFKKADEIMAFLDKANQAENRREIFSRKSFKFDWDFQRQHWNSFTTATTKLLGSFGNCMSNIYLNYQQYSNASNFADTVLATMSTLQKITKYGSNKNCVVVATKFQPRTLEKLCTWSVGNDMLQLHLPDRGICQQLALGQVVEDSKCFKTLRTVTTRNTLSDEMYGDETFFNEALAEDMDDIEGLRIFIKSNLNVKKSSSFAYEYEKFHDGTLAENRIKNLQLLSKVNVKNSLSFASKFKNLSHLFLMLRQYQSIGEWFSFELPPGPFLPHLKSFTIKYDSSSQFVPLNQIFAVFSFIRNFQVEAVNLTKKDLMQAMKIRLASDAHKSIQIHIVNLYHKYAEGRSPAESNIWTLFPKLVSVSFTTMVHKSGKRISDRRTLLIEKYMRTDSTESNPRIVQSTTSTICDS